MDGVRYPEGSLSISFPIIRLRSGSLEVCEDHGKTGRYIYIYDRKHGRYVHISYFSIRAVKDGDDVCYYLPMGKLPEACIFWRSNRNVYINKSFCKYTSLTSGYPDVDRLIDMLLSISDTWKRNLNCNALFESNPTWKVFFKAEYMARLAYQFNISMRLH